MAIIIFHAYLCTVLCFYNGYLKWSYTKCGKNIPRTKYLKWLWCSLHINETCPTKFLGHNVPCYTNLVTWVSVAGSVFFSLNLLFLIWNFLSLIIHPKAKSYDPRDLGNVIILLTQGDTLFYY